jgi:hypothetical protein
MSHERAQPPDPEIAMPVQRHAVLSALLLTALAGAAAAQTPQILRLRPLLPVHVSSHGAAIAVIPDLNGDGKPDIAVTSLFESEHIGRVYIYSGATGQTIRQLVSPNQELDNYYGTSIAAVPDANGDGIADIVVGAPADSPGNSPSQCGRAYLYSGATGQFILRFLPPSPQLLGEFGYAVAGLADLTGDGRGDVAIGAPDEALFPGGEDVGRVHLYSGATGARVRTIVSPTPRSSGDFGYALATIADLDGDGRQDLIVGAPKERADRSGQVHIISAATGQRLRTLSSPNPQNDGRFGAAVAAMPDANGDGIPDVVVGAPREFNRSGRVYVFSGATGVLLRQVQSPGIETDGRFGEAVAGLPDFNADGRGDFVVGAPHEDPGFSLEDNGRAYIYSGATGQFLLRLIPPSGVTAEYFGFALAAMPDINGTGRPEIVVGAPGDDSPTYGHAGVAYIYRY